MSHDITLNNGSLVLLRAALSAPGWATSMELIARAGQLLVVTLPELDDPETLKLTERIKWEADGTYSLCLSDKQRDCIKKCLEYHTEKGALRPSKPLFSLITALKMEPSE